MWDWLIKNPDAVIIGLGALAGHLGLRKRTESTSKLERKAKSVLRAEATRIASDPANINRVRTMLARAAHQLLSELGVKRSKAIDAILEILIDEAETYALELFFKRSLSGLADSAAGVAKEFK